MRGHVFAYETKSGKRWAVRHDLPPDPETGERRQTTKRGFMRERDALRYARSIIDEVEDGTYTTPTNATVGQYLRAWLAGISVRPTALDNYRVCAEVHVIPRLGGVRLRALTPEQVDGLYRDLERHGKRAGECRTAGVTCRVQGCSPDRHEGLKPKSVRHVHTMVRKALQDATERGHVARNVADLANPPRQKDTRSKRARDKAWTGRQLDAFLAHVRDDRLYGLWLLIATTGLRRSEAVGLRWRDVELEEGRIHPGRNTLTVADNVPVWNDEAKSEAGERNLDLGPRAIDGLREHRKRQLEERLAAGPSWSTDARDADLVFTDATGHALNPKHVSRLFTRAVDAAGLPRIGVHGLRHSYATVALRAGVPVEVVSKRLGHASVAITLDIYRHVQEGEDAQAAATAERAIFGD